jgi:hypothetical protein
LTCSICTTPQYQLQGNQERNGVLFLRCCKYCNIKKFCLDYYCDWVGTRIDHQIIPAPIRTSPEMVRWDTPRRSPGHAGMLCCWSLHPKDPLLWPVSIVMPRLPGQEIGEVYESLKPETQATTLEEVKHYLSSIREWKSSRGEDCVRSLTGGPIRSIRDPNHKMGLESSTEVLARASPELRRVRTGIPRDITSRMKTPISTAARSQIHSWGY